MIRAKELIGFYLQGFQQGVDCGDGSIQPAFFDPGNLDL